MCGAYCNSVLYGAEQSPSGDDIAQQTLAHIILAFLSSIVSLLHAALPTHSMISSILGDNFEENGPMVQGVQDNGFRI